MFKRLNSVFIAVCIVVTTICAVYLFAQRFCYLGVGFTYDELYSVATANPTLSLSYIWQTMLVQDINLPLFNILLYGWNHMFPYTEFWMHLFCALTGGITVITSFFLFPKKLGKLNKFIFVCLMAGAPVFIVYSSIVRAYSAATFFTTIFTLLSLQIIISITANEKVPFKTWLLFFISGLIGSYLHYFASGLFFVTALIVFAYSLVYKNNRSIVFWGTFIVFFIWIPWPIYAWNLMGISNGGGAHWWFNSSLYIATWDILTFLFGSIPMIQGLVCLFVWSFVSIFFTYKRTIFKNISFMLPLLQILLLICVIWVLSSHINLWLDRYFFPLMPSVLLLVSGCITHLCNRHKALIAIVPIMFVCMVNYVWDLEYLHYQEWNGIKGVVSYLVENTDNEEVLLDYDSTGYAQSAFSEMFKYYVPKNRTLKFTKLGKGTLQKALGESKLPIIIPVCSQVHLIHTSVKYDFDWDEKIFIFNNKECLIHAHPIKSNLEKPK